MKDQINLGNQSNQPVEQIQEKPQEKPKANYLRKDLLIKIAITIVLILFTVAGYLMLVKGRETKLEIGQIIIHQLDNNPQILDPSSANFKKIAIRTTSIVNNSLSISPQEQSMVNLVMDPDTFPETMSESDYIEIDPKQPLAIPGQGSGYTKVVFMLTGTYQGMIFLKSERDPGFWGAWKPLNTNEFYSLGEFLGLVGPVPQSRSQGNWKIYDNSQYSFEIKYPSSITLYEDKEKEKIPLTYIPVCDPEKMIACFYYQGQEYHGSNFKGSGLSVNLIADSNTEEKCYDLINSNVGISESRQINGIKFYTVKLGGAAAGNQNVDIVNRTFHNGNCLEIVSRIVTDSSDSNTPSGSVRTFTEAEKTQVFGLFNQVFSTFKFTD